MSASSRRSERVPLGPGAEFDLIRRLWGPEESLPEGVLLGAGDDCTVLEGGLAVSVDQAVEGVHFRIGWVTQEDVGYRAAAAALSDLAAMAAEPLGILLAMALDPSKATDAALEVQRGAADLCRREGVQVLGGDLSNSPGPMVLTVVALGRADAPVSRGGAEPGDDLWVTGWLGGSGAAVELWEKGLTPPAELRAVFARPQPRTREALWLKARAPLHALIDLSDGLAGDAGHLAAASGVGVVLKASWIPTHPALDAFGDVAAPGSEDSEVRVAPGSDVTGHVPAPGLDALRLALQGGEDFELCIAAPAGTLDEWVDPFQDSFGIPLTKVGRVRVGKGVSIESVGGDVKLLKQLGFSHFLPEEEG